MEAKLDSLLQLLQNSEARMSQEMQSIKLAVDAIKPEIATIKRSLHSLKPEKEEDEILNRLATSATSGASPVCSDTSLVVANNTNGPAAPTPTRCSTESPSRTATESAPAFAPATTLTSSTAIVDVVPKLAPTTASSMALEAVPPTAPTSLEVTTTKLLKPFTVIDLSALTPSKCSNECLVVDSTKLGDVVSHEMGEVVALIVANIISVDPGDRRQPPWPPPQICNIRLSCLGISDRSPIQLKPWPGEPQYQCSMVMHHSPPLHALDGYLPLRQIFLLWHPVRKALQSGENLSILRSPNSVWKLLQCDSGIKTSAHLCIQECPAEYHLASVTVGTVNGYHSLVQFRFQSYIASNGLLNCSSNVQSNIAWFYNCHVTVMKLQKLSWECMVSIDVHLTRGSVCHAILCVEGNKFRNLTCRESSAIFKHQGGCYVEDTTLSMCQESTMGIGIHSKVFIPCLMRGTDRIFCVLNVRSEAYQLLVQFRHSFAFPLVHCINRFCWWSPYLRLGAAILWDFIDITAQLSRTYRISLVEVFTVTTHLNVNIMDMFARYVASTNGSDPKFQCVIIGRSNYLTYSALHCSDQLGRLSVLLAYASEIWLVACAGYDLEPSSGCGQAFSQEGRDVLNQAIISDSVHVGHHYYIAFVNKIVVGYDCCCNQVYSFDTVYSDLVYYREDYRNNIKEVHTPWDPGKSALRHHLKTSAWGQAGFQEGRNVMTLACVLPSWAIVWVMDDGLGPEEPPARASTYMHEEATSMVSRRITNLNGVSSSPVFLSS